MCIDGAEICPAWDNFTGRSSLLCSMWVVKIQRIQYEVLTHNYKWHTLVQKKTKGATINTDTSNPDWGAS